MTQRICTVPKLEELQARPSRRYNWGEVPKQEFRQNTYFMLSACPQATPGTAVYLQLISCLTIADADC
jgi:hypothetical protein